MTCINYPKKKRDRKTVTAARALVLSYAIASICPYCPYIHDYDILRRFFFLHIIVNLLHKETLECKASRVKVAPIHIDNVQYFGF